ncbi:MAG: penicillin-binding protein 1C [Candidatus Berkiellales bacterium]
MTEVHSYFSRAAVIFGFVFLLVILFWLVDHIFPLNLKRFQDNSTVIYANLQPVHIFHTQDEKLRILTTVDEVDPKYLQTLIAREDRYFRYHPGINPAALLRAAYQRVRYGHIISGGSTITMQTARLLEPRPRRVLSKIIECFRALQLEWHYSKDEILSIYMTLAPFGGNIEGVNTASLAYFKKPPKRLAPSEIALLVALVQSPAMLRPDQHPNRAKEARYHLLKIMEKEGIIKSEEVSIQDQAPLPLVKIKPPREIPHLAWRLKKAYPLQSKIAVTIDIPLQQHVQQIIQNYHRAFPKDANAAVFILDHQTNKPVVYLASRDFYNQEQHGFVDYIQSVRSPGSTLKPFIYGLGFDLGLIKPDTFVVDERQRFGAYAPHNFDKELHGMVQVQEALRLSLNIPVIELLNKIGVIRFLGLLKEANVHPRFPASFEGPSLAVGLGGIGMQLEQLVMLYSALPRHGQILPISYLESDELANPTTLLSARSSQMLTNILAYSLEDDGRTISFKTGTSYGHRDALMIGYNQRYVVGIWTGMPNGEPMGPISARDLLLPLLAKIFKILPEAPLIMIPPNEVPAIALKVNTQPLAQNEPRLMFPINDTVLVLEYENENLKSIPLTVKGGTRPYTWLVDNQIIVQNSWQQQQFWVPPNSGFYTIAVMDVNGKVDRAKIEIQ